MIRTDPSASSGAVAVGWWVLAAALAGLVAAMAVHVHSGGGFAFDPPLLRAARHAHSPALDALFIPVSVLGYAGGVVPVSIVLVLVLLAARRWRPAAFAALAMAGTAAINQAIKHVVARSRPDVWAVRFPEDSYSFPSAHAMGTTTLACVLIVLAWRSRLRWFTPGLLVPFVLLVGVSRVYLGVHHPSDVLAGCAAGVAWAITAAAVTRPLQGRTWHDD